MVSTEDKTVKIRHSPFLENSVIQWGAEGHCMLSGRGAPQNSRMWQNIMGLCISYGNFLANDSRYLEEEVQCGFHTGIPSGLAAAG